MKQNQIPFYVFGALLIAGLFGCAGITNTTMTPGTPLDPTAAAQASATAKASWPFPAGTPTQFWSPVTTGLPYSITPSPMYPFTAYVLASKFPYDSAQDIIDLPVFEVPGGRWLGDFTAGQAIQVWFMAKDNNDCFVEGTAKQGWAVKGWVWCGRLSLTPPTS